MSIIHIIYLFIIDLVSISFIYISIKTRNDIENILDVKIMSFHDKRELYSSIAISEIFWILLMMMFSILTIVCLLKKINMINEQIFCESILIICNFIIMLAFFITCFSLLAWNSCILMCKLFGIDGKNKYQAKSFVDNFIINFPTYVIESEILTIMFSPFIILFVYCCKLICDKTNNKNEIK